MNTLERLLKITAGCRPDMHEPDEQELYAELPKPSIIYGLDNACCGEPSEKYKSDMGFWLVRDGKKEWFNLACVIALARVADPKNPISRSI